ncbi:MULTISPECIES: cytidylyltransferase domain-containing protein [Pectobacterium]|uniref:acylneuraminate cytidylyltransferase family protein n=1 Tax=Pectobacterium TaxID=122277 RepID=UPI0005834BAD|nr:MULTISPECIES: acylneuraminate cytidylyltransferase family protein [Pectobacterium]KHS85088.1 acylneuraminate cytidylyltransferase [Pectobacterium carotovorum subsp. carotovorum]MDE8742022.1 acylneuraminate cytidylyltransferase family protein [Pectobacterium polaris]
MDNDITKNYAFVFARGGSKGLARKNIKLLNGKPLIAYSIELAKSMKEISEVFVSTDDPEISQVAREYGATIIIRPSELASDNSPEWLSWRHAIHWVIENRGMFDTFISLPATSPLRQSVDVLNAINKLHSVKSDICIAVTPSSRNPYFNMVVETPDGNVKLAISDLGDISRRQDAPIVYDITTVVYAAYPKFILENDNIFSGVVSNIKVPKERSVDIDDIYDFHMAEILMKEINDEK